MEAEKPLTKTLLNHVNCKIVAIPSIMKIISFCVDRETFDRCIIAWQIWFSKIRALVESLQIIIECKDKLEYDFALAKFDTAKFFLLGTEPHKMLEVELPEEILGRILGFIEKEKKRMQIK